MASPPSQACDAYQTTERTIRITMPMYAPTMPRVILWLLDSFLFFFFFDNIPLRNGVPDMPPATNPAVGQHQTGDGSIGYDDDSQCLSDGEA